MSIKRILMTALITAAAGGLLGFGVLAASARPTPSSTPAVATATSAAQPQASAESPESATESENASEPANDPADGLQSQHDFQGQETGEH